MWLLLVLFLSLSVQHGWALRVEFDGQGDDYTYESYTVEHDQHVIFQGDGIAVFVKDEWCVAHAASSPVSDESRAFRKLNLIQVDNITGIDGEGPLGTYEGLQLTWTCNLGDSQNGGNLTFITSIKNYDSQEEVAFEAFFPDGAQISSGAVTNMTAIHNKVLLHFPLFRSSKYLSSVLSWEGSFVQGVQRQSVGPTGGPTVFYDDKYNTTTVVVASSWGEHPKAFSGGDGTNWNGTDGYFAPGTSRRILKLPKGYRQSVILHAGQGITATLHDWGQLYQKSRPTKGRKLVDVTLTKIGYQTDNGAYYCFCSEANCSDTLIQTVKELASNEINLGYLSFQGAGASSSDGKAPWCVDTWGIDGGLGDHYPMPLDSFQQSVGIPLQLYAPYFCPHSSYFDSGSSVWSSVRSDTTLPGCHDFDFQDIHPTESETFYKWLFRRGQRMAGMVSFEPDFMNQNFNCVPDFVSSVDAAKVWQQGMANAAAELNITIQWCYATPTDIMSAVDMPAVTNFRVSFDYCYGKSWNIGLSSMLVWALNGRPSKDTLWTTMNNRTEIPGCEWTPDHEQPELHAILALLSTGPVGISDGLGMTNATIVKRMISQDGTLLKPSKAITTVDSMLLAASGSNKRGLASQPKAQIYGTYAEGPSWIFVSFRLSQDHKLCAMDFWPCLLLEGQELDETVLAYRRFDDPECVGGENGVASGCIILATSEHQKGRLDPGKELLTLPASDFSNVTAGTDLRPTLTTVWKVCEHGWLILGEMNKYVHLSPARFSKVTCVGDDDDGISGVTAVVHGVLGEHVKVTAMDPSGTIVTQDVVIPGQRSISIKFELDRRELVLMH